MSAKLQDSVVIVTGSETRQFGTGFVIHKEGGTTYLLTCKHVVDDVGGNEKLNVDDYTAMLLASDDVFDIAVLQVYYLKYNRAL